MSTYRVKANSIKNDIYVQVPGSKSMTNRALLLSALTSGECVLKNVGLSDDSRVFIDALNSLGIKCEVISGDSLSTDVYVKGCGGDIPNKEASVYVGSAGTAARFLTAMLGLSDGCYEVTSSPQMEKRPMRPLLEALEVLGASFEFHGEEYRFPFKVCGAYCESRASHETTVSLNIDESSQFLSALLLCGPMVRHDYTIRLTGTRQARSYVKISENMMREFGYGAPIEVDGDTDQYKVTSSERYSLSGEYDIEPDVSAACYFYAMAAINGVKACVKGVNRDNTQGDMRFLDVLKEMGCEVEAKEIVLSSASGSQRSSSSDEADIFVYRDPERPLHGVTVNMSDFSDQTMTLAAIAPFADSPTTITGVAHIRNQESNRIKAICTELTRLGIQCEELADGVKIWPAGETTEATINTYDDHRMAMSFAVLGTGIPGVVIDNPECCRKTFEDFFEVLSTIV